MKRIGYLLFILNFVFIVLNFVSVVSQESYGNLTYTTSNRQIFLETGARVGEWTYDLDAARALAKINGVPLLINLGKTSGCAFCEQAEGGPYSKNQIGVWARNNNIPLVYANYILCKGPNGGVGEGCPYTVAEVRKLYPNVLGFPTLIVVDGRDGKTRLGNVHVSAGMSRNGIRLEPFNIISLSSIIDSFFNYNDNLLNKSVFIQSMSANSSVLNLYNKYGQNSLNVKLTYLGGRSMLKYADLVDWYNFSNIQSGVNYTIWGINVSDFGNLGKVSFYSGFTNAQNGVSFREMSLNDLSGEYSFSAANNENVYMKVWREDPVPEAIIAGYFGQINPSLSDVPGIASKFNLSVNNNQFFSNLSYAIGYRQGFGSAIVSGYPNLSYIDDLQIESPVGNTVSRTINDLIGMFYGWFGSNEKLNITSGQAKNGEWTNNYSSARELSIQNNRPMIVLFAKSQGEKYSKELIDKVLKSPAWQEYARVKGISLVFADFANVSTLPKETFRLYSRETLGSVVKLPTVLFIDPNQKLLGGCIYRKGLGCNGINVSVNVTNFVEILESYTGVIRDLGSNSVPN